MNASNELYDVVDDAVVVRVHVQPGAGQSAVVGRYGDALKVKVAAPPVEGRANEAVAALLATTFGVKPAQVSLVAGATSRAKRFRVDEVSAELADAVLDRALGPSRRR